MILIDGVSFELMSLVVLESLTWNWQFIEIFVYVMVMTSFVFVVLGE
jgi:hypothetical protein